MENVIKKRLANLCNGQYIEFGNRKIEKQEVFNGFLCALYENGKYIGTYFPKVSVEWLLNGGRRI